MPSGSGWKNFTSAALASDDVNGYLMSQAVMVFDSSTTRSAILVAPTEGMVSYLKDTNSVQYFNGASWASIAGVTSLSSLTDVALSSPASGQALVYSGSAWVNQVISTDPMNDGKFSAIIVMDVGV